ncbi:MAG: TlpA family protein disulfide reductase [Microscillaceae bacterium]|nr:TlpA family protein disulfide reductase [Microscillaceae bacterium]
MQAFLLVIGLILAGILPLPLSAQTLQQVKIQTVLDELSQSDDTTRVLNLWATWCGPCVKELPHFEEVFQETKGQKVKFILLAVEDSPKTVSAFLSKKGLQAPVWFLDEAHADQWIPRLDPDWGGEIPITIIINQARGQRHFHSGEMTKEALQQAIHHVSSQNK